MSREDLVEMSGTVTNVMVGGNFEVVTPEGHKILARLSGRMRRFRIRVVLGDQVLVGTPAPQPHRLLTADWLRQVREAGLGIICWHEERPDEIAALYDLGVDAICSDTPDRLTAQENARRPGGAAGPLSIRPPAFSPDEAEAAATSLPPP